MTETPHRVQRKRAKGWRMPANTVYVGRPSFWGNDIRIDDPDYQGVTGPYSARELIIADYRDEVTQDAEFIRRVRAELRGKHLACWCPLDQPCHADVLLEIANS